MKTKEEMPLKLLAHITDDNGVRKEQNLREHCVQTAEYASKSIGSTDLHHVVYLAGLLHDAGKAKKEYIEYLEDAFCGKPVIRGSINHTFAGVILIFEKYHLQTSTKWERLTCEIIGYAAGAHHGLFDCADLDGNNGFLHRLRKDRKEICYDEAVKNYLEQVADENLIEKHFQEAVKEVEKFFMIAKNTYVKSSGKVFFQISMMVRLALSAVIYGDRRDTSSFMSQIDNRNLNSKSDERNLVQNDSEYTGESDYADSNIPDWKSCLDYFEKKISEFDTTEKLNQVRCDISKQCLSAAKKPSGIYRLNIPTGGGKTLCALRYALAHAEKYRKKRIIFIIPLLSILDQNAQVIREFVWNEKDVLEHHSNVIRDRKNKADEKADCVMDEYSNSCTSEDRIKEKYSNSCTSEDRVKENVQESDGELDRYEFLAESWNAPIIVSTLVQLLNILFSQQTSAVGRMQALCDSIIVIDEVQSLPKKTVVMFNMAMNFLQQYCNASIVLSSATQPCFEKLKWPLHLADKPDLVYLNKEQLQLFHRAEIINMADGYGMDWDECTEFCYHLMTQQTSLLIVCNTKAEARILFEKLSEQAELEEWDIFHLSTSMCQANRLDVLGKLKEKLSVLQQRFREKRKVRKIICVSTQILEAGVDLSFECVVRILAGVDNLAQAAGRCNRSNEYGHSGKVYLIKLKNENLSMLKDIQSSQNSTRKVLDGWNFENCSLIDEEPAQKFYQYLYEETESEVRYLCHIKEMGGTSSVCLADLLSNTYVNKKDDEGYILHQPFQTVGENFKVFEQNTVDVLVPYENGKDLIQQLEVMQKERFDLVKFKKLIQQAQKYAVSIYEWQRKKLDKAGLLYFILDDRVLALDGKAYRSDLGLILMEEQDVDNFIL